MDRLIRWAMMVVMGCVAVLPGTPDAWAGVEARFTNPGFESGTTSGWQVYNPGGQTLGWATTTTPALVHGGTRAGALTAFGGADSLLVLYNQASVANLAAGTLIQVRFYLKTAGLVLQQPGVGVAPILVTTDADGSALGYAYEAGRFVGSCPYTPISFFVQLPAGAKGLQVQLSLPAGIAQGALYIDDLSFEVIDALTAAPAPGLVDARVQKDAAGVPRLRIDGVPEAPMFFFGNSGSPVIYEEIAKARPAGLRLIQVSMQLPWIGSSTGMLEQIVAANPDALILPRLALYPPAHWLAAHPNVALLLNEQGQVPTDGAWASPAADELVAAWKQQLELLVRFIQGSAFKNRIIGYHPCYLSTGEWFYPNLAGEFTDFSEAARTHFAQWALARYGTLEKLNAAWGTGYGAVGEVQIPPASEWQQGDDGLFRDPLARRRVIDFLTQQNELVADRLIELAGTLKALTGGHSLVAYFYGYQNELINNGGGRGTGHSGHLGLRRVLASPDIDILCSPISYYDRQVGGPCNVMSAVDSITLAGKLQLQEEDSNTWLVDPSSNPDPFNPWYTTQWDTMQCLRRNFGNVLSHNLAIWWMDLWADGRFNANEVWDNNRRLIEIYAESMRAQVAACPQVALIYDEESALALKSDSYALTRPNGYELRSVFQSSGLQVGYYQLQDLPQLPDSVRLIVFVTTFRMDDAERALVEGVKTNGRTLLWLYAPGYAGEAGTSVARMSALTGFSLHRGTAATRPELRIAAAGHPLIYGIEGRTFGPADPLDPVFHGSATDVSTTTPLGNLLANPGFEDGAQYWSPWELAPAVTVTAVSDAAQAHEGEKFLRVDFTAAPAVVTLNQDLASLAAMGVGNGDTLRLSAWHKASLASAAGVVRLAKVYGDANGTFSGATWTNNAGVAGNRAYWTRQTLDFTHVDDAQHARLRVLLNADGATPGPGTVWWDDARLEVIETAGDAAGAKQDTRALAAARVAVPATEPATEKPRAVTSAVGDATPATVTLGSYTQTEQAGLLLKDFGAWRSIFCGSPTVSVPVLRAVARYAGLNALVDADDLEAEDVAQTNGRYLFTYARTRGGRRVFQVPGEKVPNGGFERATGTLPMAGFGRWIAPFYGTLAPCSVAAGIGHGGGNGLHTGPFSSAAGQFSEPAGLHLLAEEGRTYEVSCWLRVQGLDASQAAVGDYIYLNFHGVQWSASALTFKIAEGRQAYLPDGGWMHLTGRYTHHGTSVDQPQLAPRLQVYGRYVAADIVLDDVSVREIGCEPVNVTNALTGEVLGERVTSWADTLEQNEQRIYRLEPLPYSHAAGWTLYP